MNNYCTLFDSHYLSRGLAMYESLRANCPQCHLYIYAFDQLSHELLLKLNLECVTVIGLAEFEDEKLLSVKPTRSVGEYCWTCTPSIIKHAIETYDLEACTYLDADLYFFSDPSVLIDEMGSKSVLITEHRYTPEYDQSATSGIFCVQFMTFKNNVQGMAVLNWWRNACIDWCYARFEDGKFGDQKYLDDWPSRFEGVHVLKHLGGGVAPWNVQQYDMKNLGFDMVFYHFHGFKFIENNKLDFGHYRLKKDVLVLVYKPYICHLERIERKLSASFFEYTSSLSRSKSTRNWKTPIQNIRRFLNGHYNIFKEDDYKCHIL